MHQVASTPASIPQTIAHKLDGLRRSARMWLLVHGLARFLILVVVVCAVDALLDWLFRMDRAQRLLVGIVAVSGLGYYFFRYVIAPLSAKISDDELCQRVEHTNPELAQRLISAVQFSRIGNLEALGVSPAMVEATIDEGTEMASHLDFSQSLKRDTMQQNILLLLVGIAGVIGIGIAVARTDLGEIWWNRAFLGNMQYPQDVYLKVLGVEDDKLVFPRGDDKLLEVIVTEESVSTPDIVYLETRSDGGYKTFQMNTEGEENKEFSYLFKNVLKEFQFRVRTDDNDHISPWYQVVLKPRPEIESLDLVLTPPAYTKTPAIPLSREQSPYDAIPGSTLKISGTTSEPVKKATLLGAREEIEMEIEEDKRISVTVSERQLLAGEYRIQLVNKADGLESKLHPLFRIRTRLDEQPNVAARLRGISSMITEKAVVPIDAKYIDDFAVSDVKVRYSWHGEGDTDDEGVKDKHVVPPGVKDKLGQAEIADEYRLEIGDLKLPVGAKLSLHVEVQDNYTELKIDEDGKVVLDKNGKEVRLGPNVQKSDMFYLNVVSPDELRADLLRREKDFRLEFERILGDQERLSDTCRTLLANGGGRGLITGAERGELEQLSTKKADALTKEEQKRFVELQRLAKSSDEMPQELLRTAKLQGRIPRRCEAIAERFDAIVLEVKNNRLDDERGHFSERLPAQIIIPLRELAGGEIKPAATAIESARRSVNDAKARDEMLADAITEQDKIIAKMRRILKFMEKSEGYQDAVNLLYKIRKDQERIARETEEELKRDIDDFFDDDDDEDTPDPEPKGEKPEATNPDEGKEKAGGGNDQ